MHIPSSTFKSWKAAEAELADIERAFRALSADLTPFDRERVTRQLAALKAARLQVLELYEEVKKERAAMGERMSQWDDPSEIQALREASRADFEEGRS